jgi:hypothetical protein
MTPAELFSRTTKAELYDLCYAHKDVGAFDGEAQEAIAIYFLKIAKFGLEAAEQTNMTKAANYFALYSSKAYGTANRALAAFAKRKGKAFARLNNNSKLELVTYYGCNRA